MIQAPDWARAGAIYQIFPDRFHNGNPANDPTGSADWDSEQPTRDNFFGGDLAGVAQKLDYIQGLGINSIYLTPIFSAPSNHKYDTRDYSQVDEIFGGNAALRQLVSAVHSRGMKLILDGVFNHSGESFFAFKDVIQNGRKSPYSDWYIIHNYPVAKDPLSYMCCGDASYLPKLNYSNPEVREYFLEIGKHWIEQFDIDGWRLDVPFKVPKSFWRDFRLAVKSAKEDAFLFGEIWRDARPWVGGDVFDGATNYPLRSLILDFCVENFLDAEDYLFEVNTLRKSLGDAAWGMVNLLGSHDTSRILSVCNEDLNRVLLAWVLLLTEVGIPLVYYGDEVGMLGDNDPDCRRPMIWDERAQSSKISNTVKTLLSLREKSKVLTHGSFMPLFSFVGLAAFKRQFQDQEIIVIVNTRDELQNVKIPVYSKQNRYHDIFQKEIYDVKDEVLKFNTFPALGFRVLVTDPLHSILRQ